MRGWGGDTFACDVRPDVCRERVSLVYCTRGTPESAGQAAVRAESMRCIRGTIIIFTSCALSRSVLLIKS